MYKITLEYLVPESKEAKRLLGSSVKDEQTNLKGLPLVKMRLFAS